MTDTEPQKQEQAAPADPSTTSAGNATTSGSRTPKSVAAAAKAAEEGKRVYVGNIPFKVSYADLKGLFEGFDVVHTTIPKTRVKGNNDQFFFRRLGYAFVELPSKEEAERAVNELQNKTLQDRPVSIKLARAMEKKPRNEGVEKAQEQQSKKAATPPRRRLLDGPEIEDTVYVSNLDPETTKEDVEELFKGLSVNQVSVTTKGPRRIRRRGQFSTIPARAFSLVKFSNVDDRQKAIDEFNGKTVKEKEVKVSAAKDFKAEENGTATESGSAAAAQDTVD